MKHTPGPWRISTDSAGCKEISADIDGSGLPTICDTVGLADEDEDEANARLISAAPELLEALKAVEQAATMGTGGYIGKDGQLIKTVRAAIAKAEGKK